MRSRTAASSATSTSSCTATRTTASTVCSARSTTTGARSASTSRSGRRRGLADDALAIDSYLKGKSSPLAGLGNVFVAAGRKYGVDPRLMVAISGAEPSFGKHIFGAHTAWGWGPGRKFGSWEEGISTIAKGLRTGYLDEGRSTPATIGAKWAPSGAANDPSNLNSNWSRNVESFLRELGGNPVSSSRRTTTSPVPSFELPEPPDFSDTIIASRNLRPRERVRNLVDAMIAAPTPSPVPRVSSGYGFEEAGPSPLNVG